MDYYDRRNARYDCRSAGTVLGAVGILASIGCGLLFTYIFLSMGATEFGLAVGAISVLNLVASIVWIWGINKASIVWWTVPFFVCLLFFIFFMFIIFSYKTSNASRTTKTVENSSSHEKTGFSQSFTKCTDIIGIGTTVFCMVFYIVAVFCFIKINAAIRKMKAENLRLGISYTAAPTKTTDFDIY